VSLPDCSAPQRVERPERVSHASIQGSGLRPVPSTNRPSHSKGVFPRQSRPCTRIPSVWLVRACSRLSQDPCLPASARRQNIGVIHKGCWGIFRRRSARDRHVAARLVLLVEVGHQHLSRRRWNPRTASKWRLRHIPQLALNTFARGNAGAYASLAHKPLGHVETLPLAQRSCTLLRHHPDRSGRGTPLPF